MKFKIKRDYFWINLIVLILIIIISLIPIKPVRIVFGLLFVLFLPGYIFIAALFPKKEDLDSIKRVALSFGLSIAIVPLIGLILNYTPWGIRLFPILFSISVFILICSIITWYRRTKISEEKRFLISFEFDFPKWKAIGRLDKFLSIILIISIISAIGVLIYVIAKPKIGERFTEFYILGPSGMADNYPTELTIGETCEVIVGIVNSFRIGPSLIYYDKTSIYTIDSPKQSNAGIFEDLMRIYYNTTLPHDVLDKIVGTTQYFVLTSHHQSEVALLDTSFVLNLKPANKSFQTNFMSYDNFDRIYNSYFFNMFYRN